MFDPGSGTKPAQPLREGEMNKRNLRSFALCALLTALCASAEAQQPKKVARLGYLSLQFPASVSGPPIQAFRQRLRELGYIEKQNIIIEWRFANGDPGQLSNLAAEI